MTPTQARKLAMELAAWHGGQGSGLYAVSSTLLGAVGDVKPGARNWPEPVFPADITIRAMRELSDLSRTIPGVRQRDAFRRMMDGIKSLRTGAARPIVGPLGDKPIEGAHRVLDTLAERTEARIRAADESILAARERAEAAAHERAAADIERRKGREVNATWYNAGTAERAVSKLHAAGYSAELIVRRDSDPRGNPVAVFAIKTNAPDGTWQRIVTE